MSCLFVCNFEKKNLWKPLSAKKKPNKQKQITKEYIGYFFATIFYILQIPVSLTNGRFYWVWKLITHSLIEKCSQSWDKVAYFSGRLDIRVISLVHSFTLSVRVLLNRVSNKVTEMKTKLSRHLIDTQACGCINGTGEKFILQILLVVGDRGTSFRN